jgi:transcriptional regulator of acetoin/glycerol metabolism
MRRRHRLEELAVVVDDRLRGESRDALGVERSNLYRKMRAFGIAPARRSEGDEEAAG